MSQNKGILVSAAIRPNDSLDPIATAYASEIMGGLHSATASTDRDAIIFERREWGMLCYVKNLDKTFQLKYGYINNDIMDNANWLEFNGSGSGGGEWINSVLEVKYTQPLSPTNGNRYLVGLKPGDTITGANWATYSPGYVAEWNSSIPRWDLTTPTDGMSVRVDNEDNSIYKYQGVFPTGAWEKERVGQVRDVIFTTPDGLSYSTTSTPPFDSYIKDMIFLAKFSSQNIGNTMSVNINSLGSKFVKKPSSSGLVSLSPSDVIPNVVYSLVYDGTQFQLYSPYVNADLFNIKYYIEPTDYIMIPPNYQYWVYSDLTIDGTLVNYGQVIVANGNVVMGLSGSFQNYGQVSFINFDAGLTTSFYNTDTIQFTQSNTIYGLSVSAIVKDSSLTASKLDTGLNGGATAGYFLSVDSTGDFSWSQVNTSPTNGLSTYGNSIGLGGTLSQTTTIDGDGNNFSIGNANFLFLTASTLYSAGVYDQNVSVEYYADSSVFDIKSVNGFTTSQIIGDYAGGITMRLEKNPTAFGEVGTVSSISLTYGTQSIGDGSIDNRMIVRDDRSQKGLVYQDDYSTNFTTYSLITKGYVDSQVLSAGTITQITAGPGLTGGGTGGNITLSIDSNLSGQGLTFSSGIMDVVWGGTSSGLTFSNNAIGVAVDGTTLQINSSGQLSVVVSGGSIPIYQESIPLVTIGDDSATGILLSATPSNYSRIEIFVNGQRQRIGNNDTSKDCYFGSAPSTPISFNSLVSGDQLYWNGIIAGFDLSTTDIVEIVYEF